MKNTTTASKQWDTLSAQTEYMPGKNVFDMLYGLDSLFVHRHAVVNSFLDEAGYRKFRTGAGEPLQFKADIGSEVAQ